MESTREVRTARNVLIGAGSYYLSGWLGLPLALGFEKLTQGLTYAGDFNITVVGPLVTHFPRAVVAAIAGASVALFVESDQPATWAIFPALLYAVLGFFGYHWARQPMFLDRVAQTIGALFPALACVAGAMIASRKRTTSGADQATPGQSQ
jgi:hypothetical protein